MRLNRIVCLCALFVAVAALSVRAEDKEKKEGHGERAKPVMGQVTAVSVSDGTVSWTLKTEEGEKTLSMSAKVNAMTREDGGKNIVMNLQAAGKKAPEKPKNDKLKLVSGTITAASIADEIVKVTIKTEDGSVDAQFRTHVAATLDKDGNCVGVHPAMARHEKQKEKKAE